jgi:hypothetical protein
MDKKKKIFPRNEFRYNNATHHPNYVFEQHNNKYHAVGITHTSMTFGKKNMPLNKNPKKNDTSIAYIRTGIITDKINNFSRKPIHTMAFDKTDFQKVKSKIRNYKKKRKRQNKKTSG